MKEKSRAEQLAEKRKFWKDQIKSWQEIDPRELHFLLEGLDIGQVKAHERLSYATLI